MLKSFISLLRMTPVSGTWIKRNHSQHIEQQNEFDRFVSP